MAVTCSEQFKRKNNAKARQRSYVIFDRNTDGTFNTLDEYTAKNSLASTVPGSLNGAPLLFSELDVDEFAPNIYVGEASWGFGEIQANQFTISFDISGQTQKVTQSILTKDQYTAPGADLMKFKGTIGVNEDHSVDGVELVIPTWTFQIQYTLSPGSITESYIQTIANLVGKQNDASFKGFDAGELLLTKVNGQRRDTDNWDITFGFGVSKNKTNLSVGDINGISKNGWDYLWVFYRTTELKDDGGNVIATVKQPYNAFVELVYDLGNYDTLNIPTGLGIAF